MNIKHVILYHRAIGLGVNSVKTKAAKPPFTQRKEIKMSGYKYLCKDTWKISYVDHHSKGGICSSLSDAFQAAFGKQASAGLHCKCEEQGDTMHFLGRRMGGRQGRSAFAGITA